MLFSAVIVTCFVINQGHEFNIFIGVVFETVALADFDDAYIAGAYAGDGFIVIDEIRGALEDIIGLGILCVLVPAHAGAGRKDDLCIHAAVAEQFILGYDVVDISSTLTAAKIFDYLDIGFTDHKIASISLIVTVYRMGGGL